MIPESGRRLMRCTSPRSRRGRVRRSGGVPTPPRGSRAGKTGWSPGIRDRAGSCAPPTCSARHQATHGRCRTSTQADDWEGRAARTVTAEGQPACPFCDGLWEPVLRSAVPTVGLGRVVDEVEQCLVDLVGVGPDDRVRAAGRAARRRTSSTRCWRSIGTTATGTPCSPRRSASSPVRPSTPRTASATSAATPCTVITARGKQVMPRNGKTRYRFEGTTPGGGNDHSR